MCYATALSLALALLVFAKRFHPSSLAIGQAYAGQFWRPRNIGDAVDLVVAILVWPIGVLIAAVWFTCRNGATVAARSGRSVLAQFGDQLRLAVTAGILPAWYYIFELYRPHRISLASAYLTRGETKRGVFRLLARARGSTLPLKDKEKFAAYCAERQLPAIPILVAARSGALTGPGSNSDGLPAVDLFVKPALMRGGRGSERWDHVGSGGYRNGGRTLSAEQFLERLRRMSRRQPYIVQERARNHPAIADLSNGALSTVRVLSCLDEQDWPELVAASFRMAIGGNVTVDNVHAGGLHAAVDLASGRLSQATDMGLDARLGWIERHPVTGAAIAGRALPRWHEVLALARRAHAAFSDRVVVGWDIAILADGAWLVEGNGAPDVDLIQRPLGAPFGNGRFGELLAYHLKRGGRPVSRRPAMRPATCQAKAASRR